MHKTPDITLRAFHPDDSAEICALFHAAVNQLACEHYSFEQRQQWAHPRLNTLFWQQRLATTQPTLAIAEGRIAGFVEFLVDDAYIDCLYVHPDFARQGVGRLLLQHTLNQALAARLASISVDVSFTARPLFAKAGFTLQHENRQQRNGVELVNLRMTRQLLPV